MPAKNLQRIDEEGLFLHIYNKGVEKRIIFNDEEDYKVFLDYLNDYLTVPKDPESTKKTFQVHGRTFQGIPHLPKNYFNQVELIAYNLMPNHFHLLLHQLTKGSLQNFLRSLCTRYSIYFNKKYARTGSLFSGPYKSAPVKTDDLSSLTRFFHFSDNGYSSYPEYLGTRSNSWIKPDVVLSSFKDKDDYKDFVGKYHPDQLLESILLETESEHLERREPASTEPTFTEPVFSYVNLKPRSRMTEFLTGSTIFFLLLVTLGIRNIWINEYKSVKPLPVTASEVLSAVKEVKPEALPEIQVEATPEALPETKTTLTIRIDDGSSFVNIRQKSTTNSEKIGQAHDGDTFEFVSLNSGWYEIKLADGSTGFISGKYAVKKETNH